MILPIRFNISIGGYMAKLSNAERIRDLENQKQALLEDSKKDFLAEIEEAQNSLNKLKAEYKELFGSAPPKAASGSSGTSKAPATSEWKLLIAQLEKDEEPKLKGRRKTTVDKMVKAYKKAGKDGKDDFPLLNTLYSNQ
jgi:hypothetical protein